MSKEAALELVEETLDTISENEQPNVTGPLVLIAGVVGLGIGAIAGYNFAKSRLKAKYEALAEQEISEAKAYYNKLSKDELMTQAADALQEYQGGGEDDTGEAATEPEVTVNVTNNIFTAAEEGVVEFDMDAELSRRAAHPEEPYVISKEEFLENEPENEQNTLTYYEGDSTLADDKDEPIPQSDMVVGDDNLERFGYGSGDPRTVYIRNDKLSMDFEVAKSDGKFAHEVLGLQHSATLDREMRRRPMHKLRGGDE